MKNMINIPASIQRKYARIQFSDRFLGRNRTDKYLFSRKKIHESIIEHFENQNVEGGIYPIPEIELSSIDDFKPKYLNTYKPVVLKGFAKKWDSCKNWSLEFFKDLHGDDEIVMKDYMNFKNGYQTTTLGEVIDGIRDGMGKYYRFYPLLTRHPEHIADFDYKWLRECRQKDTIGEAFQVFIGGAGTGTPLHSSFSPNLFVQAYGKKKWRIFSDHYSTIVDPAPARNFHRDAPTVNGKQFDPFNPDYDTFPIYKYIDIYETELEAGDILWNPPYYWHAVQNPVDCIGVGYRWVPLWYCLKYSPTYFLLDLMTEKPNFLKSLNLFKQDINLLHLAETNHLKKYLKDQKDKSKIES